MAMSAELADRDLTERSDGKDLTERIGGEELSVALPRFQAGSRQKRSREEPRVIAAEQSSRPGELPWGPLSPVLGSLRSSG